MISHRTRFNSAFIAAFIGALVAVSSGAGQAQVPIPPLPGLSPSPSPTPTPTQSSPSPRPTPTHHAPPTARPTPSAIPARPAPDPAAVRGIEAWRTRPKTPSHTTTELLSLIQQTLPGATPTLAQLRVGFGRFPVVGYVWYQDDYGAPRYNTTYAPHEGTDLFAVVGTPVIATIDGTILRTSAGGTGGNAIFLMGDDGVRYYYGHLSAFVTGLVVGQRVRMGDQIAYVGDSGNAKGTYPHVHFEVNPGGLGTVNPKPALDSWLLASETRVRQSIVGEADRDAVAVLGAARWDTLMDLFAQPSSSAPALWTAATGATTVAYADVALSDLLAVRDWSALGGPAVAGPDPSVGFDALARLRGQDVPQD